MACATDRLEKAEFLCELLECGGQDLGEADKRGDTPMHAAAYNGSTACLLLLLQYGVAPDVRNSKGLRPIDLASRRGQSACEKILMEYQLHHHVNNSYFDSVLFLATLEVSHLLYVDNSTISIDHYPDFRFPRIIDTVPVVEKKVID